MGQRQAGLLLRHYWRGRPLQEPESPGLLGGAIRWGGEEGGGGGAAAYQGPGAVWGRRERRGPAAWLAAAQPGLRRRAVLPSSARGVGCTPGCRLGVPARGKIEAAVLAPGIEVVRPGRLPTAPAPEPGMAGSPSSPAGRVSSHMAAMAGGSCTPPLSPNHALARSWSGPRTSWGRELAVLAPRLARYAPGCLSLKANTTRSISCCCRSLWSCR